MFRPGSGSGRWVHNVCVCVGRCMGQQGLRVHWCFQVYGMIRDGRDRSRAEECACVFKCVLSLRHIAMLCACNTAVCKAAGFTESGLEH